MNEGVGRRTIALWADDFGMNRAVNAGIAAGFRRGLLTGTSLLVNGPAAGEAVAVWEAVEQERRSGSLPSAGARRRLADPDRSFDLGLHLNLTQGKPLTDDYPNELRRADGSFCGVWRLARATLRASSRYQSAIEREIAAQLARGRDLGAKFGRIDGHQYVEMLPTVAAGLEKQLPRCGLKQVRIAREPRLVRTTLGEGRVAAWLLAMVKRRFACRFARLMRKQGFVGPDLFFGTAHAGRISGKKLRQFAAAVDAGQTAEIGLHPGESTAADDRTEGVAGDPWFDPLAERRPQELAMLLDADLTDDLAKLGVRLGRLTAAGASA